MPRLPDKILINCAATTGMGKAIYDMFEACKELGMEIEQGGWGGDPEALALRKNLVTACTEHFAADMKYFYFLHQLGEDMDTFINSKLAVQPKP